MKKSLFVTLIISLFFTSCGSQTDMAKIPGVDGPFFNVQDGKILLTIGFENLNIDQGLTLPIPRLKNSDFSVVPRLEGGTLFQVGLDPKDFESDDFRVVPSTTLPDGRPFPFTVDGTLPALAVNTPRFLDSTFYLSKDVFGFFIPVKYPLDVSAFTRIKINGQQVGLATIIKPNPSGTGSGVMMIFTLKNLEQNELQKLLKLSTKHKSIRF